MVFLIKSESYLFLFTGNTAEPLYVVKGTEKATVIKDMKDPYGHFIHTSDVQSKQQKNSKSFRPVYYPPLTMYMILT